MLSTRYDNATLQTWNWNLATRKSYSPRSNFEKKLNATKCRIQHQRGKKHCGHDDHSIIGHTTFRNSINSVISPEQDLSLAKGKMIYLVDQFLEFEYQTKPPIVITDGPMSSTNRNHCNGRGWITRDTIFPVIQMATLKVRMSTARSLFDTVLVLPCALVELVSETTSLDHMPSYGTIATTVYCQSSEPKMWTWWNKERNDKSLVDRIQQRSLLLKLKFTRRSNVKYQQIFIRSTTTYSLEE